MIDNLRSIYTELQKHKENLKERKKKVLKNFFTMIQNEKKRLDRAHLIGKGLSVLTISLNLNKFKKGKIFYIKF